MRRQLSLFEREPVTAVPAPGISQPRVWVRRLVLWGEPGEKLQDISLLPGLNIVWSPDPADVGTKAEATTLLGHGSGKTLFCRLLRYCLGEDRFAPERQRNDIAAALPEGMVGAEVLVDGVPWSVVRPLGHRRRHFAAPNVGLEELAGGDCSATGIEPLTTAIEMVMTDAVGSILPGFADNRAWLTAIALVARDQECRFGHVLDWRSAQSGSGSPVRGVSRTETLDALRALIGAVDPAELALRGELAALEKERDEARSDVNYRRREVKEKRKALLAALGLVETDMPPEELADEVLRRHALAKFAHEMQVPQNDEGFDLGRLRERRRGAQDGVNTLQNELDRIAIAKPLTEALLSKVKSELPGAEGKLRMAVEPMCPVCEVPIDRALAEGCKLSQMLPDLDAVHENQKRLKEEARKHEADLKSLALRQASLKKDIERARKELEPLDKLVTKLEEARDARSDAWDKARSLMTDVERLSEATAKHARANADARALDGQIKERREHGATLRGAQAEHFGRLAKHFDAVIRRLAGQEAEGVARLTGNGLELEVRMGGNCSTPAIESLKVIACTTARTTSARSSRP
jgi:hypothetical protein